MSQPENFGRYQLLKRLARGGMGEVWLARQAGMDGFEKLVVIKRILPHLAEEDAFVHMFLDEGKIAARLNHSNIVNIFDLGQEGEYYFLAMEYIHGEDIRRIWKQASKADTALSPALACRIIADACAGLDFAHKKADQKGEPLHIVHRDVSPHNIIVSFDGGVKVIDFGIARARGRISHTATGTLKGRFEYMSPEHASGYEVDHRTDVFALGVVLWESLSGRRLFKRDSDTATLLAVSRCEVPLPSSLNPEIPPELDAVVLKALTADKDDRYVDAAAFRLALEDWIVASRQPASNAHLAAFMRELYSERLAKESSLGHPVIEEITQSKTGVAPVQPPPARHSTASPESAQPARSRAPVFIVAAIALVLLSVIAVLLLRPQAPQPQPAAPVADAPKPAPEPAAPAARVALQFASDPAGATVILDGETVGTTPLNRFVQRSNTPIEVTLKLRGYKPYEQTLMPFEASSVTAHLERIPLPAPRPSPPKPEPASTGIKTAR